MKYFENTYANFISCETPSRLPDYISESGSCYWYEGKSVIRLSNHWGKVATCKWRLDGKKHNRIGCGKAFRFEKIEGFSVGNNLEWILCFGSRVSGYLDDLNKWRNEITKHWSGCEGGKMAIDSYNLKIVRLKENIKSQLKPEFCLV